MKHNLYWSVYQNLEKELVELSNHIHIDDKQLSVYSMKIAELLIRTAVEFESLAKELYFKNGGDKPNNNELYFDTDCLAFLKEKWNLDLKKVQIVSGNFYFDDENNKILTPLRKAHKRGSSSERWLRAYQALKHSRGASLVQASLKNLINAMAALYILNIYYKDTVVDLANDKEGNSFDVSCGSMIFSVFLHPSKEINIDSQIIKQDNFDECIYVVAPNSEAITLIQDLMKRINTDVYREITSDNFEKKLLYDLIKQKIQDHALEFKDLFDKVEYQATLNKSQF